MIDVTWGKSGESWEVSIKARVMSMFRGVSKWHKSLVCRKVWSKMSLGGIPFKTFLKAIQTASSRKTKNSIAHAKLLCAVRSNVRSEIGFFMVFSSAHKNSSPISTKFQNQDGWNPNEFLYLPQLFRQWVISYYQFLNKLCFIFQYWIGYWDTTYPKSFI